MKILITGASGFIGMHLWRELEARDHRIVGIDRKFAGALQGLERPGVGNYVINLHRPDLVVHLAARYGRVLCRDRPYEAVLDNAAATTELAATCAALRIPVLYASSSEVYGDHGHAEITEDSELRMPTTIYGLSKRWGEEVLRLYLAQEDLTIVRMNMVYGPGQNVGYGQCALSTFIDKAVRLEPFDVHRDTSRSWLYIDDCVRALRMLIEDGIVGTYNLGNDDERLRTTSVAAFVLDAANAPMGLARILDPPSDQIRHKVYSSAKLEATIDWVPEIDLVTGIGRTVDWAQAQWEEGDASHAQESVA